MEPISQKRIWIYSQSDEGLLIDFIESISKKNSLIGVSQIKCGRATFPRGELVTAMQAAIRGEIDILLVDNYAMLGTNPQQIEDILNTFAHYNVLVKSYNNLCNSIS